MNTLKPYPAYMDSGVEWLGEVPEHWTLQRASTFCHLQNRGVRDSDKTVTAFRDGQVTLRTNRRTDGFTEALQEIGYQGVREGDLVIHSMDGFAGAIGVSDSDGKMSPVVHVYQVVPGEARYYALLLRVAAQSGFIESLAKGIRERSTSFDRPTFKSMQLPIPSGEEQMAVLDFLDRETAEIDEFVAESEKLITLLNERRAAVITQAVTKGLDPTAPMKDTGIEWLGSVPESWDVMAFARGARISNGADYKEVEVADGGYPVYGSGGEFRRASSFLYDGISVLFGRKGTVNRPLLVSGKFWTVDTMFYSRIDSSIWLPEFVYYWATILPYELWATDTALPSMTSSAILSAIVPTPSTTEQRRIVEFLGDQTAKIDEAIATAREAIALAKERRQALISAAVTGKIDVRAAA